MEYPLKGEIDDLPINLSFEEALIRGTYVYEKYMKPLNLIGYYTVNIFILNERKKMEILEIEDSPYLVNLDKKLFEHALSNFVSNAIEIFS